MTTHPRIAIVCQARMSSSRLPGKVLLPLSDAPLLLRFLERIQLSAYAQHLVVATTNLDVDDAIASLCIEHGYTVYRGHPTDLLDRHFHAARLVEADVVVKIPSDCPLIDPHVIDMVIEAFIKPYPFVEYASNLHPGTWPDGNDVEVMTMLALHRAWVSARQPHEREHTTPWLWENNPNIRVLNVMRPDGQVLEQRHRWTIDYPEDYSLIRAVYDALYSSNPAFTCEDILHVMAMHPEIDAVNTHLRGRSWYTEHLRVQALSSPSPRIAS